MALAGSCGQLVSSSIFSLRFAVVYKALHLRVLVLWPCRQVPPQPLCGSPCLLLPLPLLHLLLHFLLLFLLLLDLRPTKREASFVSTQVVSMLPPRCFRRTSYRRRFLWAAVPVAVLSTVESRVPCWRWPCRVEKSGTVQTTFVVSLSGSTTVV